MNLFEVTYVLPFAFWIAWVCIAVFFWFSFVVLDKELYRYVICGIAAMTVSFTIVRYLWEMMLYAF